jgi:hypothetical protein
LAQGRRPCTRTIHRQSRQSLFPGTKGRLTGQKRPLKAQGCLDRPRSAPVARAEARSGTLQSGDRLLRYSIISSARARIDCGIVCATVQRYSSERPVWPASDRKLRGCDLVRLQVNDVCTGGPALCAADGLDPITSVANPWHAAPALTRAQPWTTPNNYSLSGSGRSAYHPSTLLKIHPCPTANNSAHQDRSGAETPDAESTVTVTRGRPGSEDSPYNFCRIYPNIERDAGHIEISRETDCSVHPAQGPPTSRIDRLVMTWRRNPNSNRNGGNT